MCPVKTIRNPGIMISQMWVDLTFCPSDMLIVKGLLVILLLTTSMPSIMKMEVALVSTIACVDAIVIPFRYWCDGWLNMLQAVAAIDCIKTKSNGGDVDQCKPLEQFDAMTVTSLLLRRDTKRFWWGPKESICTVTKLLNLFATSTLSAPPCQKFLGSNVLCILLVHVLQPIDRNICALSLVNVTLCDGLRQ